jgi:hypothetical protein
LVPPTGWLKKILAAVDSHRHGDPGHVIRRHDCAESTVHRSSDFVGTVGSPDRGRKQGFTGGHRGADSRPLVVRVATEVQVGNTGDVREDVQIRRVAETGVFVLLR